MPLQSRVGVQKAREDRVGASVGRLGARGRQNAGALFASGVKVAAGNLGEASAGHRLKHLVHVLHALLAALCLDDVVGALAHALHGAAHF